MLRSSGSTTSLCLFDKQGEKSKRLLELFSGLEISLDADYQFLEVWTFTKHARRCRSDMGMAKKKHVIVEPKEPECFRPGEDYVGSLIPNAARPLGKQLFLYEIPLCSTSSPS